MYMYVLPTSRQQLEAMVLNTASTSMSRRARQQRLSFLVTLKSRHGHGIDTDHISPSTCPSMSEQLIYPLWCLGMPCKNSLSSNGRHDLPCCRLAALKEINMDQDLPEFRRLSRCSLQVALGCPIHACNAITWKRIMYRREEYPVI